MQLPSLDSDMRVKVSEANPLLRKVPNYEGPPKSSIKSIKFRQVTQFK
jgi:hypothetical protein